MVGSHSRKKFPGNCLSLSHNFRGASRTRAAQASRRFLFSGGHTDATFGTSKSLTNQARTTSLDALGTP